MQALSKLALVAALAVAGSAYGQTAPSATVTLSSFTLSSNWSSAEFAQRNNSTIVALKEIGGYNPLKFAPNIHFAGSLFAGYSNTFNELEAGLAITASGPISGKFGWLLGVGDKIPLDSAFTLKSFNIKGVGGIFGLQYKY